MSIPISPLNQFSSLGPRSVSRSRRARTLDDIPEEQLEGLADKGFDLIWFLGVRQTQSMNATAMSGFLEGLTLRCRHGVITLSDSHRSGPVLLKEHESPGSV